MYFSHVPPQVIHPCPAELLLTVGASGDAAEMYFVMSISVSACAETPLAQTARMDFAVGSVLLSASW